MNPFYSDPLQHWLPWKMAGDTVCQWLYVGVKSFTEPFFEDTISACRKLGENRHGYKILSSLEMMNGWSPDHQVIPPAAFIFHISRCGSTLLSQLLSINEANIVLSEVPFFDEILRLPFKKQAADIPKINESLQAAIKFYSRKRKEKEKQVFIKTDSWHLHFYEQIRMAYPAVPFILLYRDPGEVLVSQQRQRGMHTIPGVIEPGIFGFTEEKIKDPDFDRYTISVLEGYFNKMIAIARTDQLAWPVNYKMGINSIVKKINAVCGITTTPQMETQLNDRSRYHAKYPQQLFEAENKQLPTSERLIPVLELYHKLDAISYPGIH